MNRANLGGLIAGVDVKFGDVFNEAMIAYGKDFFLDAYAQPERKDTAIFKEESTEKAVETYEGITTAGKTKLTAEGASFKEDRVYVGYRTAAAPVKYTNSVSVTMEARDDVDRAYKSEIEMFKALIVGAQLVETQAAFDLLNYAFTAQSSLPAHVYPYGDGVPTCSNAHPRPDGGAAQANTFSAGVTQLPLSETSQELARLNLLNQTDGRGNPIRTGRQLALIVPATLEKTAMILNAGMKRSGTANNDINIYDGNITVCAAKSAFLTSATAWFLMDPTLAQLVFLRRAAISTYTVTEKNLTQIYFIWHRFCVVVKRWYGLFGSRGDYSAFAG
jgi:hypothetical protein